MFDNVLKTSLKFPEFLLEIKIIRYNEEIRNNEALEECEKD